MSYATDLTINEMSESVDSTVDNFKSVEVKIDSLETVFGMITTPYDDYDHEALK